MHLEFRVKPINDKKDTYWTSPILNHETVTGSKFFAEYIYNAFALFSCHRNLALRYKSI